MQVDIRLSPFFFRLASNASPDIESVGRIKKKRNVKNKHSVSDCDFNVLFVLVSEFEPYFYCSL